MLNRLEYFEAGAWAGITSRHDMAAAFVTAADLLRSLAPGRKANAIPNALGIGNTQSPNGLSEDAYLLRLDAVHATDGRRVHFLVRNTHTNGPYIPLQIIFERRP